MANVHEQLADGSWIVRSAGRGATTSAGDPAGLLVAEQSGFAYGTTTQKALTGGQHQNMVVTAGNQYEINSDVDLYAKTSSVASDYGFIGNTDAIGAEIARTAGSLATMTGLDFGTDGFTFESWLKVDGTPAAGTGSFFLAGKDSTTLMPFIIIKIHKDATSGNFEWGVVLQTDSAADTVIMNKGLDEITSMPAGEIVHVVIKIDRQGSGNDVVATLYLNGTPTATLTSAGTDDAGAISMSLCTDVGSKLQLMTNWNNTHSFIGDVYNVRFYTTLLTDAQISARTNAGPSTRANDAGDINLTWEVSFQDWATWTSINEVEASLGNAVFDNDSALIGSVGDYITVKAGGEPALPSDSLKVWAGGAKLIKIPAGDSWLNVYSKPGAAGDANITLIGS